jgi:hypothetical protein
LSCFCMSSLSSSNFLISIHLISETEFSSPLLTKSSIM